MSKDLIEQIKTLIKHIQENPEALEKAKIYDLKSKKLLADTNQSKPQDYSIPKDAKNPQEATQATAEPVNPEFGKGSIYAIKTNHGHIIGQNISGKSPNYHDVLNWLKDKNVPAELVNPAPFNKKFASYMSENADPHTIYETDHNDPNYIAKLDSIIEKHPNSPDYKEDNYIPKKELNENTNFAFTPLSWVDSTRFGTPDGNLWVTKTKNSHTGEVKYSIGKSKGESRLMAYQGKNLGQGGNPELMPDIAGQKQHKGNLIVGVNSYLRTKVPFFIVQNLDLYPFYQKTADGYRVGVMGTYRNGSGKPLYAYSESEKSPKEALDNAINHFVLEAMKIHSKPEEPGVNFDIGSDEPDKKTQKLNSWLTNSIYRSPKISLKDIVNEPQTAQKSLKDDYFETLKKDQNEDSPVGKWFYGSQKDQNLGLISVPRVKYLGVKDGMHHFQKESGHIIKFHENRLNPQNIDLKQHPDQDETLSAFILPDYSNDDQNWNLNPEAHPYKGKTYIVKAKPAYDSYKGSHIKIILRSPEGKDESYKLSGFQRGVSDIRNFGSSLSDTAKHLWDRYGIKVNLHPSAKKYVGELKDVTFKPKLLGKSSFYFQQLKKAKIYSFKDKKVLSNLPSIVTPRETQPIFRNKKKGITNRKYLKQVYSPNIMPEKQDVPGGDGVGKSEYYKNLVQSALQKNLKPKYVLEDLAKAKVFSLASGKLQFDTSNPEHKMDTTDPSHLVAAQILPQGDPNRKRGMMVVGSNVFARQNLPEEVIHNHDVFYHFFPTSELTWKVGATITERNGDKGTFVEASGLDINQTLKDLNSRIKQRASSKEQDWHTFDQNKMSILNNLLYKQPKISLKDIQSLEPYKPE